ncbi:MAG: YoaK family protein [Opitutus sp.]
MITKIERWAWWGGATLAVIAGMVNAVGFLSYAHQAVTHLTGTTTLISLALVDQEPVEWLHLLLVVLAFVLGAAISGFLIQHSTLKLGRRYGAVLLLESVLLGCAAALMKSHAVLGSYFASAACGLQNAMATTYSGSLLRTTHLSGMFTDVGAALGHWARGIGVDWLRVRLSGLIIVSFGIGGFVGALLFRKLQYATLYVPAVFTGIVGIGYTAYAHAKRARDPVA